MYVLLSSDPVRKRQSRLRRPRPNVYFLRLHTTEFQYSVHAILCKDLFPIPILHMPSIALQKYFSRVCHLSGLS